MDIKPAAISLSPTKQPGQTSELRRASEGFEELFLTQFLKAARAGSLGDDLMGSSAVDKTRDLFDAEIAKSSSSRTGFGIADAVERQFAGFVTPNSKVD
jgi:flagellar protein FlgJ